MWLDQSGVMFGLDARVALAIFAALAAVVGYVSFGRVEIAKQAAVMAELDAFENAVNNFQADAGTFLLFTLVKDDPSETDAADIQALWKKDPIKPAFQQAWHGPYLERSSRKQKLYGIYGLSFASFDRKGACDETSCSAWLTLTDVPDKVWQQINEYYDEAHGSMKEPDGQKESLGRVQAEGGSAAIAKRTLYFRLTTRATLPQPPQQ